MKRFRTILLVCDRESEHEGLLTRAISLAKSNQTQVILIDPVNPEPGEFAAAFAALPGARGREIEQELLTFHRSRLSEIAASIRAQGIATRTLVPQGVAFVEIIREVLRDGHDLVMKGAAGSRAGWPGSSAAPTCISCASALARSGRLLGARCEAAWVPDPRSAGRLTTATRLDFLGKPDSFGRNIRAAGPYRGLSASAAKAIRGHDGFGLG